jgi:hypothetical protein
MRAGDARRRRAGRRRGRAQRQGREREQQEQRLGVVRVEDPGGGPREQKEPAPLRRGHERERRLAAAVADEPCLHQAERGEAGGREDGAHDFGARAEARQAREHADRERVERVKSPAHARVALLADEAVVPPVPVFEERRDVLRSGGARRLGRGDVEPQGRVRRRPDGGRAEHRARSEHAQLFRAPFAARSPRRPGVGAGAGGLSVEFSELCSCRPRFTELLRRAVYRAARRARPGGLLPRGPL